MCARLPAWCGQGKTLSILGAGTIGSHIATVARVFGMRTIGYKRTATPAAGFDVVSGDLREVLSSCDVLVNCLPNTPATVGLLSGGVLAHCAAKAPVFLNCGRGSIIDDASLLAAVDAGHLSAAWLDVFVTEPLPQERCGRNSE